MSIYLAPSAINIFTVAIHLSWNRFVAILGEIFEKTIDL